ncbi:angiopoietin-related protein 5-like [Protopterus annectens]|uniref:angiopoietin-related protein 5-like n=1 Tax=Protopterus annectens TaxID=7888 RepID=UPI001CFC33F1|nr:angiopoietin-related protein 5-like [Protopterus annectens]
MKAVAAVIPLFCSLLIVIIKNPSSEARKNDTAISQGTDCTQIRLTKPDAESGIYWIQPAAVSKPFKVYCDMREDGGWTLIQRHNGNDSLSFRRPWDDYKNGFGKHNGEHWLGLYRVYALTTQKNKSFVLHVEIGDFEGDTAYAMYDGFKISNELNFYKLNIGNYSGTAGDSFTGTLLGETQAGSNFSTIDKDNDQCSPCISGDIAFVSCSNFFSGGGWWFSRCGMADLNGEWHPKNNNIGWQSGVYWKTWKYVMPYSLKYSEMKVKSL